MKIKSFKKMNDNRYKLTLDNSDIIILYDDIILKYGLLFSKNIDNLEKLLKENKSLECYYKAIKYLRVKTRCVSEVMKYLKRFDYSSEDINRTINKLKEENYLNDDNYIKLYINDQINLTLNGPKKIMRKLKDLGFNEEEINLKLNEIDKEVWISKLEKIINKKIISNKKDSARKIKERILYSCINDGFNKEDILSILEDKDILESEDVLENKAIKLYQKLCKKYDDNEVFYYLKGKLINLGFKSENIDKVIDKIKNTSE